VPDDLVVTTEKIIEEIEIIHVADFLMDVSIYHRLQLLAWLAFLDAAQVIQ